VRYRDGTTQRSAGIYPTKTEARSVRRAIQHEDHVAISDQLSPTQPSMLSGEHWQRDLTHKGLASRDRDLPVAAWHRLQRRRRRRLTRIFELPSVTSARHPEKRQPLCSQAIG